MDITAIGPTRLIPPASLQAVICLLLWVLARSLEDLVGPDVDLVAGLRGLEALAEAEVGEAGPAESGNVIILWCKTVVDRYDMSLYQPESTSIKVVLRKMGGKAMKKGVSAFLVIAVIAVVIVGWVISTYNALVQQNEFIDGQWAQVENQLQRRYDLIPNLVNTVKGYAQHEEGVFTAIADARAKLNQAATPEERTVASNEVESALARLLVIVENYPELKADAQFTRLMDELSAAENRIAVERLRFNEQVKVYNTKVKQFPAVLIARIMGFGPRTYFEMAEGAAEAPKVEF